MRAHARLLFPLLVSLAAPAAAEENDFQSWTSLVATGALRDRVVGSLEVSGRFSFERRQPDVILIRPAVGYRVSPAVTVWAGYARASNLIDGTRDTHEDRFFAQLDWQWGRVGAVTLATRTRVEHRDVRRAADIGYRARFRLRATAPVNAKGVTAIVQTEPFVALNTTDWGQRAGFDQVRTFVGAGLPIVKRVTLETGYQNRYQRRVARADRNDHIFANTLTYRF